MADWGPTSNDVRHRFVTNAVYEMLWGIQVGGIVTANSAPPYNITTGADANRDGVNNDRPEGVGFNSARGRQRSSRPTCACRRSSASAAAPAREVLWEMFNVFNTVNFTNYQGNQSPHQASPRQASRRASANRGRRSIRSRVNWGSN